jgi:hypothetical protein
VHPQEESDVIVHVPLLSLNSSHNQSEKRGFRDLQRFIFPHAEIFKTATFFEIADCRPRSLPVQLEKEFLGGAR